MLDIFAKRLKWLRVKKGYSQYEMAEKLGISQSYYSKFENDQAEPNLETLAKLPDILGENLEFLLGIEHFDTEARKLYSDYQINRTKYERILERIKTINEYLEHLNIDEIHKFEIRLKSILEEQEKGKELKDRVNNSYEKMINYLSQIPCVDPELLKQETWDKHFAASKKSMEERMKKKSET